MFVKKIHPFPEKAIKKNLLCILKVSTNSV